MTSKFASLKENFQRNKILVENFTFLSVLQISNLVLFLLMVPYLFRILGTDLYGLIVFAQAIVFYFSVLINFGFNLTATRDVSVNRHNLSTVGKIVSSVLTVKSVLFAFSFFVLLVLTFTIPKLSVYRLLFLFTMINGLSEALFPIWYFQGLEKMKYITAINISTRVLATIAVFIIIRKPDDYLLYPLVYGSGSLAGAIIALSIVFFRDRIKFIALKPTEIIAYAGNNFLYFISNVSTQLYLNANRVIAGLFLGMANVAIYDIAEKIINMLKVPYSLIGQTLFPKFAKDRNTSFLKKIMIATVCATFFGVAALWFLAGPLVVFFSGNENQFAVNVLRILSFALIPISISIFYGDLILISADQKSDYAALRFRAFLLYSGMIAFNYFTDRLNLISISSVIVITEVFVAVHSYYLSRISGFRIE